MGQSKLERHAQEIIPGLWLGERWACRYAHQAGFLLENPCSVEDCFHAPILTLDSSVTLNDLETDPAIEHCGVLIRCEEHLLQKAHHTIEDFLKAGSVLVHCLAGGERSPLVVATWLSHRHGFSLSEAYKLIIKKRPIVEERAFWLGQTETDR